MIEVGGDAASAGSLASSARLEFYDWEPNLLPPGQVTPALSLFTAVQTASKQKPRGEATDIPPGGPSAAVKKQFGGDQTKIERYYDGQNDTAGDKYYVFGPTQQAASNDPGAFYYSCRSIADYYQGTRAARGSSPGTPAKGTACAATMRSLAAHGVGPPAGSIVIKVPRGIVVVKDEARGSNTKSTLGYWTLEDDSELSGSDVTDPKQTFDPQTNEPIVSFSFTDKGRAAFARATKREAQRGSQILVPPGTDPQSTFQRFAITLDNQLVSLATINYRENPEGIPGDTGAQINGIGTIQQTQDLANNLRIGALPLDLKLVGVR